MIEEKAVGYYEDGTRYVDYEVLYRNCLNVEWSEWPKIYEIMRNVEESGSPSWKYPFNPLMHLVQFMNNYLLEKKVKEKLQLEWNNNDHAVLVEKAGSDVPDYIDKAGSTYELKQGNGFERAANIRNWHNADIKLFYNTGDKTLYYYHSKIGNFEKICELRAEYVDINRYRIIELKIRNKFDLHY